MNKVCIFLPKPQKRRIFHLHLCDCTHLHFVSTSALWNSDFSSSQLERLFNSAAPTNSFSSACLISSQNFSSSSRLLPHNTADIIAGRTDTEDRGRQRQVWQQCTEGFCLNELPYHVNSPPPVRHQSPKTSLYRTHNSLFFRLLISSLIHSQCFAATRSGETWKQQEDSSCTQLLEDRWLSVKFLAA